MHRNERHRIRSNALNAAKRADKRLTFVPVIFLILRSCGMLRFCIYISSSEEELKSTKTLNIQEVLVYLQVGVQYQLPKLVHINKQKRGYLVLRERPKEIADHKN